MSSFTDVKQLKKVVKGAICSKQYGFEDFLSELVADACLRIMPKQPKNFNVDNVRIIKILGASIQDSSLVNGMVFNREPEGKI